MAQVLELIKSNKTYYPKSLEDYAITCSIGSPLASVDSDYFPVFKSRCTKYKVKIEVTNFEDYEEGLISSMQKKWPYDLKKFNESLHIEVPKTKKAFEKAQKLCDLLVEHSNRHMFDTEVKTRKFSQKIRFSIERTFNGHKKPDWKEGSKS